MTSGGPMTVSILIVNWNSKDLLRQCLLSIRRTCVDLAPEIVVVDSASFDGCAEMLASEFPEVLRRALSPYDLWAPPSDFAPPGTVAVEAVGGPRC